MYMYMYHVYSNGTQAINFNFHVIFWFATHFEKIPKFYNFSTRLCILSA